MEPDNLPITELPASLSNLLVVEFASPPAQADFRYSNNFGHTVLDFPQSSVRFQLVCPIIESTVHMKTMFGICVVYISSTV